MKVLAIIFLLFSSNSCQQTDVTEITYTATTRGYYYKVVVTPTKAFIHNSRNESEVKERDISANDWINLQDQLKSIDIANISELKRPSTESYFDGAAAAHISVATSNKTYESLPFDQGNPPKEIKEFVKAIHSLCDKIE